jgi:hypothetical protein
VRDAWPGWIERTTGVVWLDENLVGEVGKCQARAGVNGSLSVSFRLLYLTGIIPQTRGSKLWIENFTKLDLNFRGTRGWCVCPCIYVKARRVSCLKVLLNAFSEVIFYKAFSARIRENLRRSLDRQFMPFSVNDMKTSVGKSPAMFTQKIHALLLKCYENFCGQIYTDVYTENSRTSA